LQNEENACQKSQLQVTNFKEIPDVPCNLKPATDLRFTIDPSASESRLVGNSPFTTINFKLTTMTLNWGHKVTIGFTAFAGMIVYLVVQCMNTHYDLVSKEYYKDELQYQQVIDETSRANQLSSRATVSQTNDQLIVQLPAEMQQQPVTGIILFYSIDNSQKDKQVALQLNGHAAQTIDSHAFIPGNYTAKIRWSSNKEQYYTEVPVTIH
jgi:hypothetical protein